MAITHQLFCIVKRCFKIRWCFRAGVEKSNAIGTIRLLNAYVFANDNTVAVPRDAEAFTAKISKPFNQKNYLMAFFIKTKQTYTVL